jgi:integrase
MSIVSDLKYSINRLYKYERENSYTSQSNTRNILMLFSQDLVALKFGLRDIHGLKQKHILSVVEYWKSKKLKVSTIKNRMAVLRKLCFKLNKCNIIPTNTQMKIGRRTYKPTTNRAIFNPDFKKISNPYVRVSLELQRVFGLRREESLKIRPHSADKGDRLELLPSWCKGGRGRVVPIRTEEQRYWLKVAKQMAGKYGNSLIPEGKSYKQQISVYEKQTSRAGLKNLHGLRHAYAQQLYKELTGWDAPINGGPQSKQLTRAEKRVDYRARMILTEQLGHGREQITVNYLGR